MITYYTLDGKTPVPCSCGANSPSADWRVDLTKIGEYEVSTIFLGVTSCFNDKGMPLIFETMIFGGKYAGSDDEYLVRCSTWDQAEAQHAEAVQHVQKLIAEAELRQADV